MKGISHGGLQWHQVKQVLLLLSDVQTASWSGAHQSLRSVAAVCSDRYI